MQPAIRATDIGQERMGLGARPVGGRRCKSHDGRTCITEALTLRAMLPRMPAGSIGVRNQEQQEPARHCGAFRRLYAGAMNFPNPHQAIDAENLERDRRTAAALRADSGLVRVAQRNLSRWLAAEAGRPHPALVEWQAILEFLTPVEVADFL